MKRINKKLLEALDKLIAKYSGEEWGTSVISCPLCTLYWIDSCKKCPNEFFGYNTFCENNCTKRGNKYPFLNYKNFSNGNTLKQFWTDYKSLYLQRIYTNSEIMEILIKPFKEQE